VELRSNLQGVEAIRASKPIAGHCERSEAIHSSLARRDGLPRGACHRARIRATRWLAMTADMHSHSRGALRPKFSGLSALAK